MLLVEEGNKLSGSFAFKVLKRYLYPVLLSRVAFLFNKIPDLTTNLYRVLNFC